MDKIDWIKVGDRLPEKEGVYMVYIEGLACTKDIKVAGFYIDNDGKYFDSFVSESMTHWADCDVNLPEE